MVDWKCEIFFSRIIVRMTWIDVIQWWFFYNFRTFSYDVSFSLQNDQDDRIKIVIRETASRNAMVDIYFCLVTLACFCLVMSPPSQHQAHSWRQSCAMVKTLVTVSLLPTSMKTTSLLKINASGLKGSGSGYDYT